MTAQENRLRRKTLKPAPIKKGIPLNRMTKAQRDKVETALKRVNEGHRNGIRGTIETR